MGITALLSLSIEVNGCSDLDDAILIVFHTTQVFTHRKKMQQCFQSTETLFYAILLFREIQHYLIMMMVVMVGYDVGRNAIETLADGSLSHTQQQDDGDVK